MNLLESTERSRRSLLLVLGLLGLFVVGCGEEKPRTRNDNFRDRMELPRLYLTAKSGKRVVAPASKGLFVDEETGELCWPALMCTRSDCPGRSADGQPCLFIAPDTSYYVTPEGKIESRRPKSKAAGDYTGQCPACLTKRNPKRESAKLRQQYVQAVRPYVPPETAKRLRQLDEELGKLKK